MIKQVVEWLSVKIFTKSVLLRIDVSKPPGGLIFRVVVRAYFGQLLLQNNGSITKNREKVPFGCTVIKRKSRLAALRFKANINFYEQWHYKKFVVAKISSYFGSCFPPTVGRSIPSKRSSL